MHYTPTYSSWINQVERWFTYLTDELLRRSDHRSVQALEKNVRNWGTAWNENPNHSSGPRSQIGSSNPSHDFYN
jgi:transposase